MSKKEQSQPIDQENTKLQEYVDQIMVAHFKQMKLVVDPTKELYNQLEDMRDLINAQDQKIEKLQKSVKKYEKFFQENGCENMAPINLISFRKQFQQRMHESERRFHIKIDDTRSFLNRRLQSYIDMNFKTNLNQSLKKYQKDVDDNSILAKNLHNRLTLFQQDVKQLKEQVIQGTFKKFYKIFILAASAAGVGLALSDDINRTSISIACLATPEFVLNFYQRIMDKCKKWCSRRQRI